MSCRTDRLPAQRQLRTPLNNGPISDGEQMRLRADFEEIRRSSTPPSLASFTNHDRSVARRRRRHPAGLLREDVECGPGFSKLTSNYLDLTMDEAANAEWCMLIAEKVRGIDRSRTLQRS
ncbi:MAG: hypothetical protein R2695_00330 [Acidimicrobiales bacterium]